MEILRRHGTDENPTRRIKAIDEHELMGEEDYTIKQGKKLKRRKS